MLQLTYDVGDILEYYAPEREMKHTLLVEHVEDIYTINGNPWVITRLLDMFSGNRYEWKLPKYLGRCQDIVLNKLA